MLSVAVDTTHGKADAGDRECRKCGETKPSSEYYASNKTACKPCVIKRVRDHRRRDPEAYRAKYRNTYKLSHLRNRFGVSPAFVSQLEEDQGGVCAICGIFPTYLKPIALNIDHCHSTGKIRGLLCNRCNPMLGLARDNPWILLRAVQYMEEADQKEAPIARCFLKKRVTA